MIDAMKAWHIVALGFALDSGALLLQFARFADRHRGPPTDWRYAGPAADGTLISSYGSIARLARIGR
jgi:hypothetical protein